MSSTKKNPPPEVPESLAARIVIASSWVVLLLAAGLYVLATADQQLADRWINKWTRQPASATEAPKPE